MTTYTSGVPLSGSANAAAAHTHPRRNENFFSQPNFLLTSITAIFRLKHEWWFYLFLLHLISSSSYLFSFKNSLQACLTDWSYYRGITWGNIEKGTKDFWKSVFIKILIYPLWQNIYLLKMGHPDLFFVYFHLFQSNITIFTTKKCQNVHPVLGFEPINFSLLPYGCNLYEN